MEPTNEASREAEFFRAPWDPTVWVATACAVGILLALAGILVLNAFLLFHAAQVASGLCFLGSMVTLCAVMVLSQSAVTGYRIEPDAIVVVRRRGEIRIPIDSIQSLTLIDTDALRDMRRVYGIGWIFGNSGVLSGPRWERLRVYITRRDNLVLIERRDEIPVMLSPDKPRVFVHAFHSARGTK